MKTFLLKEKKPICKWGKIPHGTYFQGEVPDGFSLAVCPHEPYIILDVDIKPNVNGFNEIPINILNNLNNNHFFYMTKSGGCHYWLKYTGNKVLKNRATKEGLDLRTKSGYVRWNSVQDPKNIEIIVKETDAELNSWLEEKFI